MEVKLTYFKIVYKMRTIKVMIISNLEQKTLNGGKVKDTEIKRPNSKLFITVTTMTFILGRMGKLRQLIPKQYFRPSTISYIPLFKKKIILKSFIFPIFSYIHN